jgi:DNA polymerase-3 subunit epsilon
VGAEDRERHHARLREALADQAFQAWPYPGTIGIRETSLIGGITEVHLFRDWCWLGSARDEAELGAMLESPARIQFDPDIYRLLVRRLRCADVLPFLTQPTAGNDGMDSWSGA